MRRSAVRQRASVAALQLEMRRLLEARRDPDYFEYIAMTIGVRDRVIGVRVPQIRAATKQFLVRHAGVTYEDLVALMNRCAERRVREELLFVTFALARFRRQFDSTLLSRVEKWVDAIDNWETCDQLAMSVAADLVARDIKQVGRLIRWTLSSNPWRRRFALAAAAALNQKGRSFPLETLSVCVSVLNDPDAQVRKAVGWAIREASKADAKAAFDFLCTQRRVAHKTILREASKNLPQTQRARIVGSEA